MRHPQLNAIEGYPLPMMLRRERVGIEVLDLQEGKGLGTGFHHLFQNSNISFF